MRSLSDYKREFFIASPLQTEILCKVRSIVFYLVLRFRGEEIGGLFHTRC